MGLVPAGAYRNRGYAGKRVRCGGVAEARMDILYDPQTSGGLLASIPEAEAAAVLRELALAGLPTRYAVIGRVLPQEEESIHVL